MTIRVGIIDPDPRSRARLSKMARCSGRFNFVASWDSTAVALKSSPLLGLDVMVLRIAREARSSSAEWIRRLKRHWPATEVLVLAGATDGTAIGHAVLAGANGYLCNEITPGEISAAIAMIHRGGSPFSRPVSRSVVELIRRPAQRSRPNESLSAREQAIFDRLAAGHPYKQIGHELGISPHTVRSHVNRLYRKLGINSRGEATKKASAGH